tara:strand:+ start:521 stop:1003 length:483 start_codon:yes stop_codon:yes gene_type:complete
MNSFKNKKLKILRFSFYIILLDQISKVLIMNFLNFERSIVIIPNFLSFTLVKNKGAAFSLFSNSTTLLTIISILASFLLTTYILTSPTKSLVNSIGLSFLLGGTIGNGLDRLFKGYVIDFLELAPINFPIFNLADISINIAIILFIIDLFKSKEKPRLKN